MCLFMLVCVEGDGRERDVGVKWISEKTKERDGLDGGESVRGRETERKMKMNIGVWVINAPLLHC